MRVPKSIALSTAVLLGLFGFIAIPASASATQQSAFGTTFDVRVGGPGAPSILGGSVTYVEAGSNTVLNVDFGGSYSPSVDVSLLDSSSQVVSSCTIPSLGISCSMTSVQIGAGSQSMSISATDGTNTVDFPVTFFGVTPLGSAQSSVGLEWQDAAGNWVDDTGTFLFMLQTQVTAYRVWVQNNTNAPIYLEQFNSTTYSPELEVQPGQREYLFTSTAQPALNQPTTVSMTTNFHDAAGYQNGNGTGGGTAPVPGSVSLSATSVSGGDSVTLSGSSFSLAQFNSFNVELNSNPIPLGSVTADQAGDFSLNFTIPTNLPPGLHHVNLLNGNYVVASLPITMAGLAETGTNPIPYLLIAGGFFAIGAIFLLARGIARRKNQL